jgi:dephospho-CoA kinase
MSVTISAKPAILLLTGASGAGKTTLLHELEALAMTGVECINCDRVKVEGAETMEASDHQATILRYWLAQLSRREGKVKLAVLDTQIRPHRAREVLKEAGILQAKIVLIDCEPEERNARLRGPRGQPELASARMDCWAAYLRGQADALALAIIDTSGASTEKSLELLSGLVKQMLEEATCSRNDFGPAAGDELSTTDLQANRSVKA